MTYPERLSKTTDYYVVVEDNNGNLKFPISDGAFGRGIYVYQTIKRAKENIEHQKLTVGSMFCLYHLKCQALNVHISATTCAICISPNQIIALDKSQWVNQTGEILDRQKQVLPQPNNDIMKAEIVIGPVEDLRLRKYLLGTQTRTFMGIKNTFFLELYTRLHLFRITTFRKNIAICMCLRNEAILNKMFTLKTIMEGPLSYFDISK